jgi:putative Ca2+/H+ antiporter (TMEM165/GDT1 family)
MEAFLTSTALVALAEIGDKTQLLAILLATRFRQPVPIILGILVATLSNHFLAALLGQTAASWLEGPWFRLAIALSFLAMAAWTLVPDRMDEEAPSPARFGAFLATCIAFFLVEIGDKTQVATIALGARFQLVVPVTLGTTLGMMIANVPAVFLGHKLIERISLHLVRRVAAALFAVLGIWLLTETLVQWG